MLAVSPFHAMFCTIPKMNFKFLFTSMVLSANVKLYKTKILSFGNDLTLTKFRLDQIEDDKINVNEKLTRSHTMAPFDASRK